MARWVLDCPNCNKEFTHTNINDRGSALRDPFTSPEAKPEFPDGGLSVVCPNCKNTSVYQRYQLTYQAF
jgi:endogenous inhibitor of DNA gyrase (YacG/DUF329 family)